MMFSEGKYAANLLYTVMACKFGQGPLGKGHYIVLLLFGVSVGSQKRAKRQVGFAPRWSFSNPIEDLA
jgi:hypothetical protein